MQMRGLLFLSASWLPTVLAQGTKFCINKGGTIEAPNTANYRMRRLYTCATVFAQNGCSDEAAIRFSLSHPNLNIPMNESECHKYHCSSASECNMCGKLGFAAGASLTEPCSCQIIKAEGRRPFPYNCVPNPLRARGDTCVHSYQCSTNFCCPA